MRLRLPIEPCRSVALLMLLAAAAGCSAPLLTQTPSRPAAALSEHDDIRFGAQVWQELLVAHPVSENSASLGTVERIGGRLAQAAGRPYRWEFEVLDTEIPLCLALPGGKVAVSEGLIAACQSEAELAAAMAHEIGHMLAQHERERIGDREVSGGGSRDWERFRNIFGARQQYAAVPPFSPQHEQEADSIGLLLLARAGYDPQAAVEFWSRTASAAGQTEAAFAHTHPPTPERLARIDTTLPQALSVYENTADRHGRGLALDGRAAGTTATASRTTSRPGSSGGNSIAIDATSEFRPHRPQKPADWVSDLAVQPPPGVSPGEFLMPEARPTTGTTPQRATASAAAAPDPPPATPAASPADWLDFTNADQRIIQVSGEQESDALPEWMVPTDPEAWRPAGE